MVYRSLSTGGRAKAVIRFKEKCRYIDINLWGLRIRRCDDFGTWAVGANIDQWITKTVMLEHWWGGGKYRVIVFG